MISTNHTQNREIQQDARAWADFTGTNYTAALRQMTSPLAQGLLGDRASARRLIATLDDHELIGARGGEQVLSENGFRSKGPWRFNGETDFIELALITDMLRIFTPVAGAVKPEVGSYSLKHTAEWFLAPHCSYVSNGRLIWAAAALGVRIVAKEGGGPNLLIGVSEREHDYVSRMVGPGRTKPQADHYRPAGYGHLQAALVGAAAGERITDRWIRPTVVKGPAPFHYWLTLQADRVDEVGVLAGDYTAGVRDSDHRIAPIPDELLAIFLEVSHGPEAYDAVVSAIAEWTRGLPSPQPIRTERIGGASHDHGGWGAGAGTMERYEYHCPCGAGRIVEEHDNVPGFWEHSVRIDCDKCRAEWHFVEGKAVRERGLEPSAAGFTH